MSLENPVQIFSRFLCLNFRLPHWRISLPPRWGRDSSTSHEAPALGMKSETSAVSWITPWPTSCGINPWIRCFWKQRPGNWTIPWTSNAVIRASPPLAVGWVLGGITEDMADLHPPPTSVVAWVPYPSERNSRNNCLFKRYHLCRYNRLYLFL